MERSADSPVYRGSSLAAARRRPWVSVILVLQYYLVLVFISFSLFSFSFQLVHFSVLHYTISIYFLSWCAYEWQTRSPAIAEGPRDAGVPVEIW